MRLFRLWRCWPAVVIVGIVGAHTTGAVDIIVANSADSGNGTLRQAIQFNESLGGENRILFSNIVTGTITLTNSLGELFISKDVTIVGPGAMALAVSGNNVHRVFHLTNNVAVSISGLKISNGQLSGSANGPNGAGILQDSGALALSDCIVSSNQVNSGSGGGISANGTVLATRCTVFGNHSVQAGGIDAAGTFTAISCTIFGNVGNDGGGGIYHGSGSLFLTNCTISGNSCLTADSFGGGIFNGSGTATIRNSIIASNTANRGINPDCYGTFTSGGFNLIGAINGSSGWGALGDQFGTTNNYLNPLLGPLQDNGGPTLTMAPQIGSPVVDQGNSSDIFTDQRGRPRPHTIDSVGSIPLGGDRSDIGAFELNPLSLIVSNNNDSGSGSLRQAIQTADRADSDVISFAPNVVGPVILTTGELVIGKPLVIQGPTVTPITVSGNNASRVIRVTSNSIVSISSLTIANGATAAQGGGIFNDFGCTLALNNCAVVTNISGNNGGGVANNGSFAAYNCTFAANLATFTGGGIYTYAGPVALRNCTVVSNNAVNTDGGGICNYSLVAGTSNYITSTLVAGNSAQGHADVIGVFTSGGYNLIGQIDYSTPSSGPVAGVATSGLANGISHDQAGSPGSPH